MKRTLLLASMLVCTLAVSAQSVGDKVEIESAGAWYPGTVLKVEDSKF